MRYKALLNKDKTEAAYKTIMKLDTNQMSLKSPSKTPLPLIAMVLNTKQVINISVKRY